MVVRVLHRIPGGITHFFNNLKRNLTLFKYAHTHDTMHGTHDGRGREHSGWLWYIYINKHYNKHTHTRTRTIHSILSKICSASESNRTMHLVSIIRFKLSTISGSISFSSRKNAINFKNVTSIQLQLHIYKWILFIPLPAIVHLVAIWFACCIQI